MEDEDEEDGDLEEDGNDEDLDDELSEEDDAEPQGKRVKYFLEFAMKFYLIFKSM